MRVVGGDLTELSGVRAVASLVRSNDLPTAIFAANDLSAAGALDRLGGEGLRVPEDVSLVGYDNTGLAAMHHIGLTTIDQPRSKMGRQSVATLLAADRPTPRGGGRPRRRPVAGRPPDDRSSGHPGHLSDRPPPFWSANCRSGGAKP